MFFNQKNSEDILQNRNNVEYACDEITNFMLNISNEVVSNRITSLATCG